MQKSTCYGCTCILIAECINARLWMRHLMYVRALDKVLLWVRGYYESFSDIQAKHPSCNPQWHLYLPVNNESCSILSGVYRAAKLLIKDSKVSYCAIAYSHTFDSRGYHCYYWYILVVCTLSLCLQTLREFALKLSGSAMSQKHIMTWDRALGKHHRYHHHQFVYPR